MNSKGYRLPLVICLVILAVFVLNACNMPGVATPTVSSADAIYTAAAQTVEAQLTQVSRPSATPAFQQTPAPTTTEQETAASPSAATETVSTTTPAPAATTPARAATDGCNQARFVQDVTIPDNADMSPGETFVKTWRLENTGTCTWTSDYRLVFSQGDAMGSPASSPLTDAPVAPGESVEVSVQLTAPETPGTYRSEFKLSTGLGEVFGLKDDKTFWAQIQVVTQTGLTFDFVARASSADWSAGVPSDLSDIAFGGDDDDPNGVAKIKDRVTLETGMTSGKILLMVPPDRQDGIVRGVFPAYTVQPGDRFNARLGFMMPQGSCGDGNAEFRLGYRQDGEVRWLDAWNARCDQRFDLVEVNLGDLSGESVRFVLEVSANGSPQDDWALWNSPLIEN